MNTARKIEQSPNTIVSYPREVNDIMIRVRHKLQEQTEYFNSGETREVSFRVEQLKRLRKAIQTNKEAIIEALHDDLKKSPFEAYTTEIAILFTEIDHAIANTKKWARPLKVKTPAIYRPAKSLIIPEPYGRVFIIGTWNYPFQLIF